MITERRARGNKMKFRRKYRCMVCETTVFLKPWQVNSIHRGHLNQAACRECGSVALEPASKNAKLGERAVHQMRADCLDKMRAVKPRGGPR